MSGTAVSAAVSDEHFGLVVVGAGQGGIPLARAFARSGRRVALVERVHVGGTCVNDGCSPTKTIIASARAAHVARRAGSYGVHLTDDGEAVPDASVGVSVDLERVHERKQEIVDSFRSANERSLKSAGVEVVRGRARFVGPRTVRVTEGEDTGAGAGGERTLSADLVVVNTGLRAAVPDIKGLADVPYLTSTSILELTERPGHLIVMGGGYVGVEFAQAFRRFGSRVTVIQRNEQLLPREDHDIAARVADILREEGMEVLLSAEAMHVRRADDGIHLVWRAQKGGAEHEVVGSHLLVATGRVPNTDDLGLDVAGVDADAHGYVRVNEWLETSVPGVLAMGDVKGGPAFTHISYDDFRILRTNLLDGGSATTAGRLVPYTVYIDPQLGAVGMTEREARSAGRRIRVARLPMSSVARAREVDETRGLMKAVVDADTNQILGATVLGLQGGEIASLFQVAMMGKLPYTALRDAVFSHPTLAESLNNLFSAMDQS